MKKGQEKQRPSLISLKSEIQILLITHIHKLITLFTDIHIHF